MRGTSAKDVEGALEDIPWKKTVCETPKIRLAASKMNDKP